MDRNMPTPVSPNGSLPRPDIVLPIHGGEVVRADDALIERLQGVSSATASAMLHKMGIRQTYIQGPVPATGGSKVVGSILTLQFMPQREDIASGIAQEYSEKYSALWAVFETTRPGDVLAIQAFGDPFTGVLGEMLITYFQAKGGIGVVADGYIRDWPRVQKLGLPVWTRGFTPNYASQASLFPWAYNVPIACSRVLVLPGDIMIADDDGAVVIPRLVAPLLAQHVVDHEDWEAFSRIRMAQGGDLKKYYPLSDEGRQEYEAWRAANGST